MSTWTVCTSQPASARRGNAVGGIQPAGEGEGEGIGLHIASCVARSSDAAPIANSGKHQGSRATVAGGVHCGATSPHGPPCCRLSPLSGAPGPVTGPDDSRPLRPGHRLDHVGQAGHVPEIDGLRRRVRVPERPADGDVGHAVRGEHRAVVAAVGRAHLQGGCDGPAPEPPASPPGAAGSRSCCPAPAPPRRVPAGPARSSGARAASRPMTKVSMACTRTGRRPSALAAARAPSRPISSRVLQRKITVCRRRSGLSRRTASTWAADPTRSSNERPVARVPPSRTNSLGMVSVCPTLIPSASVASREAVPTSARSDGGVRFNSAPEPESRGMNTPGTGSRPVCTSAGFASQSEGKSPPTGVRSSDPSSLMAVIRKPDLVQMRHKDDGRLSLAQGEPEIAGAVGLGPGPPRKQPLDHRTHRLLHAGHAIALHQRREHTATSRIGLATALGTFDATRWRARGQKRSTSQDLRGHLRSTSRASPAKPPHLPTRPSPPAVPA